MWSFGTINNSKKNWDKVWITIASIFRVGRNDNFKVLGPWEQHFYEYSRDLFKRSVSVLPRSTSQSASQDLSLNWFSLHVPVEKSNLCVQNFEEEMPPPRDSHALPRGALKSQSARWKNKRQPEDLVHGWHTSHKICQAVLQIVRKHMTLLKQNPDNLIFPEWSVLFSFAFSRSTPARSPWARRLNTFLAS